MNDNSLMEKFADPDLINTLSINDKMAGSVVSMLIGIGMTFLVLILLWVIVGSMTKSVKTTSTGSPASSVTLTPAPQAVVQAAAPQASGLNDAELVAVLSAAIAAFEGGQGASGNLIIRKINRIPGRTPAWSGAGRMDCIESRKI